MASALLLINFAIGFHHIVRELKRLSELVDIYIVDSTYDMIAKINVNSEEELQEITISKIRKGIKSTLTLVIDLVQVSLIISAKPLFQYDLPTSSRDLYDQQFCY